jgi:flagellar secretion chaperone FliS
MWNNGHDAYLESRILSATPLGLVSLLYQGCVLAVRDARHHLAAGQIAERSQAINRACEILMELNSALDHKRGGEISQRLAQLYAYMQTRLLQANMEQSEAPLAEVLGLLGTLAEAWEGVQPAVPAPVKSVWAHNPVEESYAPQGWSL